MVKQEMTTLTNVASWAQEQWQEVCRQKNNFYHHDYLEGQKIALEHTLEMLGYVLYQGEWVKVVRDDDETNGCE